MARILGTLLVAGGCSDDGNSAGDDKASTNSQPDVSADGAGLDAAAGVDAGGEKDIALDCPGGEGCPCKTASDCDNNLCVEVPAGMRCAHTCVDTCPDEGFSCRPLDRGGDTVTICTPTWLRLCDPCEQTSDCQSSGLSSGHCVRHGAVGSFCSANCKDNADCPVGSRCTLVTTTENKQLKQCVPLGKTEGGLYGTCACSQAAIDRGASTTCETTKPDETKLACQGLRTCTAKKLGPCELPSAKPICYD